MKINKQLLAKLLWARIKEESPFDYKRCSDEMKGPYTLGVNLEKSEGRVFDVMYEHIKRVVEL